MNVATKIPRKPVRAAKAKSPARPTTARRSLSDEVAQRISDDFIMSERTAAGELLPSESELCDIYEVSRVTVRAAIRSLWDHGLISVRNGVGAVVLPRAREVRHGLDRLASIDTFARETGHKVDTGHLQWETIHADADISRKLQVPVGASVLQVKRSKIVDGEPVAWIIDIAPLAAIDEKAIRKKFNGSILDVLLADNRYRIDYADSEVKPCIAKGEVKEVLRGDEDGLLLFLDTVTITVEGPPILWGRIWLDPSHFTFSFHRRRFR
jgi:DNA-binding GntR family transcriptional regulator